MSNETIKIAALAARLGMTTRAIRRLEEIGCFAAHTPGKWEYPVSDVNSWLERTTGGNVTALDDIGAVIA
ncbi:hypothetical protein [Paraburkholderia tropica]|uniref:hypothetical protein n=1 Tax=Paraburkholderia tropica TaxID=92647 RepID=UPI002AB0CCB3|nr:hypothetical protein [Paraburkholderia tropica]